MNALSQEEKRRKLRELARSGGHASVVEMFKACATDSVSPAICTERDCSYVTEMEPDQDRGYCEACGGNTVVSRPRARRPHLRRAEHAVPQLLPVRHMRPRMD